MTPLTRALEQIGKARANLSTSQDVPAGSFRQHSLMATALAQLAEARAIVAEHVRAADQQPKEAR